MNPPSNNPYDPDLTTEQEQRVSRLSEDDLILIDLALLSNACHYQRKVAMLVGNAIGRLEEEYPNIPDIFYSGRVAKLVDDGYLEAFGNLRRMRYSEVKLTNKVYNLTISDAKKEAIENSIKRESYYIFESKDLCKIKRYDDAIEILNKGLATYPKSVKIYREKANIYYRREDYDLAFESLNIALELSSDKISLYFTRARWEFELELFEKSIEDFNKIIEANDTYFIGTAYNYRAIAFTHLKKYKEALEDYYKIPEDHDLGLCHYNNAQIHLTKKEILERVSEAKNL